MVKYVSAPELLCLNLEEEAELRSQTRVAALWYYGVGNRLAFKIIICVMYKLQLFENDLLNDIHAP